MVEPARNAKKISNDATFIEILGRQITFVLLVLLHEEMPQPAAKEERIYGVEYQ